MGTFKQLATNQRFIGLSTETKPTSGVNYGAEWYEVNAVTNKIDKVYTYVADDGTGSSGWVETAGLNFDANLQVGSTDVSSTNPIPVSTIDNVYEATLTLDTNAYADGDLLADTQSLDANAFPANGGKLTVLSVNVMDLDDNKGALDIVLLRSNTSLGTENSAPNISDANADEILDVIPIYATDYKDIGGASWASVSVGRIIKAASDATALYIGAISRDTKTYTASGLVVRVGVINRSA